MADADLRGFEELGTASFEVAAWIKRDEDNKLHVIAGKQDGAQAAGPGWQFRVGNSNKLIFSVGDGTNSLTHFGSVVPSGVWTHLRVVVDRLNGTVQLYVNGQPDGGPGDISAFGSIGNSQDLRVGTGYNTTTSPNFNGDPFKIDQVEIKLME